MYGLSNVDNIEYVILKIFNFGTTYISYSPENSDWKEDDVSIQNENFKF